MQKLFLMKRKKLVSFDWAIKRLLRDKVNFVVLEGFLSELLFETIKIEEILESESNQETDDDKFNRVDVLTKNSKNELIIIEIQSSYEIDYFASPVRIRSGHRMAYGTSKAITEHQKIGDKYLNIKKVISINIVYFDLGQGEDYIYKGRTNFVGIHENDILGLSENQKKVFVKKEIADIFPEYYLLKVNQFNDIAKNTLDEWIYLLKNSEVKDNFNAKGLKEAYNVLDVMSLSKEEEYGYNRYIDSISLKASELYTLQIDAQFKAVEREKKAVETIAKNCIQEGLDNVTIHKITKLSIESIDVLRNEIKNEIQF